MDDFEPRWYNMLFGDSHEVSAVKTEETRRGLSRQRWDIQIALLSAVVIGVLIGTLVSNGVRAARERSATSASSLPVPSPVDLSSAFSRVAKQVEPAVVNISSESTVHPRERRSQPDSPEDFFERFFDFGPRQPFRVPSLGSGVLIDPDGYILTNHHVVEEADKIKVRLHGDPKEYRARLVGFDRETDLAVIKIDANRKLPVAELGNSDSVNVGDWVLAIGSPFGLEATVTAGIISYKGREGVGPGQFQRFLQTDAAINRGNSGGPLVNMAGQVIGINTMIATAGGGNLGIGFALPSSIAREVYNQIVKQGRVVRGSIGIQFNRDESQNEVVLRSFGAQHGIIVDHVQPGGPSDRAGLRQGDVIFAISGRPVHTGDDLVDTIASTPVGQEVKLSYLRDRKEQQVTLRVEDRCKVFAEQCGEIRAAAEVEGEGRRLGIRVEEASPAFLQQWGLDPEEDQGLLVREVEPNSFAEEVDLAPGDLILEIRHQGVRRRVRTLRDSAEIERELTPGSEVVFGLKRRPRRGSRWLWVYLGGTLP